MHMMDIYAYDGHIMDSARVTVILGILIIIVTYYAYDGHIMDSARVTVILGLSKCCTGLNQQHLLFVYHCNIIQVFNFG